MRGRITSIKITENCSLTHLLFVDDVLIFLNGSLAYSSSLQYVFDLFQKATGMVINIHKSSLLKTGCSQHEVLYIRNRFPFPPHQMEEGLKYLGFHIKHGGYKISDWTWIIAKVEKRLNIWYNRYLSRAGRLTLIKAVLEGTLIYWMSLAWIPRGILDRLKKICCRFLWKGNKQGSLFAWVKWDTISRPKKWGGWGIKILEALAAKLGWQLITTHSLWTKVVYEKYIAPGNMIEWIRREHRGSGRHSNIWKEILNSLPTIWEGLTRRIHQGQVVHIGSDPWIGCGNAHRLPASLIAHLQEQGVSHISHIAYHAHTTPFQQA